MFVLAFPSPVILCISFIIFDGLFMVTECTARLHCSCVSSGKNMEGAYGFTREQKDSLKEKGSKIEIISVK